MAKVTIYTKPFCPYCAAAMSLLKKKGAEIEEIVAAMDADKRQEMIARANGKNTFPQIFIGETHVGGSDDLHVLEDKGELDPLLAK